jgi:hypothetical protein
MKPLKRWPEANTERQLSSRARTGEHANLAAGEYNGCGSKLKGRQRPNRTRQKPDVDSVARDTSARSLNILT